MGTVDQIKRGCGGHGEEEGGGGDEQKAHEQSASLGLPEGDGGGEEQGQEHGPLLKAHAVVDTRGIVGKAVAPEWVKELAQEDEVAGEIVGFPHIDCLIQQWPLNQQGDHEDCGQQNSCGPRGPGQKGAPHEGTTSSGPLALSPQNYAQFEKNKSHQQRREGQQREDVGQQQPGEGEGGQGQPSLPAPVQPLFDQAVEGQEDPGEPEHEHEFGVGGAHVDVEEVIGGVDVEQAGHQPGQGGSAGAALDHPVAYQGVHAPAAEQGAQGPGQLDRRGHPRAQEDEEFGHVEGEGGLDDEGGIAVALDVVHGPAGPQGTVSDGGVELDQVKDAVAAIVGAVKVAGREQWGQGKEAEAEEQNQIGVNPAQPFQSQNLPIAQSQSS